MKIELPGNLLYSSVFASIKMQDECMLQLEKDGILIQVEHPSRSALYANKIPGSMIDTYDRGEHNKLAMYLEKMKRVLPNSDTPVTLSIIDDRLSVVYGNNQYFVPLLDPDSVMGVPERVPDLDNSLTVYGGTNWICDFAEEAEQNIYHDNKGPMYISFRADRIYVWAGEDSNGMAKRYYYKDFKDYTLDWRECNNQDTVGGSDPGYTPKDDNRATTIISTQFAKKVFGTSEKGAVSIDNHMPLKAVIEEDNGVLHSWTIAPRIPNDSSSVTIPERVIENLSL